MIEGELAVLDYKSITDDHDRVLSAVFAKGLEALKEKLKKSLNDKEFKSVISQIQKKFQSEKDIRLDYFESMLKKNYSKVQEEYNDWYKTRKDNFTVKKARFE